MKFIRSAVLTVLTGLVSVSVARADMITLDITAGYYPGNGGGEFTAYTTQNYLNNYSSSAIVNGGFETFCLETGVDFTPGTTYYYTLGNITQPYPASSSAGSGLALTTGAAYLYYEFATGQLVGFNYNQGSARQADANLLQAALWALQGGQTYGSYVVPNYSLNNDPFYNAALDALGGLAGATNAYTGTSVQVIQMWANANNTGAAQNQLVLTGNITPNISSVPDGGMTAGLLGMSLFGMGLIRIRHRKSTLKHELARVPARKR
jgi:hypothetical protein